MHRESVDNFIKFNPQKYINNLLKITPMYAIQKGTNIQTQLKDNAEFFELLL